MSSHFFFHSEQRTHDFTDDHNLHLLQTPTDNHYRHNDQRLMSSLEKFAKFANPDKILMVGEALVGTDSVAQARNFNAAFGAGRGLDGFIISKCDTVGDMVGTLVSMVHSTGVPVLFVGEFSYCFCYFPLIGKFHAKSLVHVE